MEEKVLKRRRSAFASVFSIIFYFILSIIFSALVAWGVFLIISINKGGSVTWFGFRPDIIPFINHTLVPIADYFGKNSGTIITAISLLFLITTVFGFYSAIKVFRGKNLTISEYKKIYKHINFSCIFLIILFFIFLDLAVVNAIMGGISILNISFIVGSIFPLFFALLLLLDKQRNKNEDTENTIIVSDTTSFEEYLNSKNSQDDFVFKLNEENNFESFTKENNSHKVPPPPPARNSYNNQMKNNEWQNNLGLNSEEIKNKEQNSNSLSSASKINLPPRPMSEIPSAQKQKMPPPPPPQIKRPEIKDDEDIFVDFNFGVDKPAKQPQKEETVEEKLKELRNLLAVGVITKEEFEEERAKLISNR